VGIGVERMDEKLIDVLPEGQNDGLIAAISHAMILFPILGFTVTVIIWLNQREKSRYVAFQSLQAGIYQFIFWLFAPTALACVFFISFIFPMMAMGGTISDPFYYNLDPDNVPTLFSTFFMFVVNVLPCVMFLLLSTCFAYGFVGAIMSFSGRLFTYIFVGGIAGKVLVKTDPANINYQNGTVTWGFVNSYSWPFAKIDISEDKIKISAGLSSFEFHKKDIIRLIKARGFLGMVIKIEHSIHEYPRRIFFYSYNFKDLIKNLEKFGYEVPRRRFLDVAVRRKYWD
jgi:hypothetical protein